MKKKLAVSLVTGIALASALGASPAVAVTATMCMQTGFIRDGMNLTAAVIADGDISGQTVDASAMLPLRPVPCNIGIYYGPGTSGTVEGSEVKGANYFGIVVTGEDNLGHLGTTSVDVTSNSIHDIGENPPDGRQHGVGVYYFASSDGASATGAISGNAIFLYQKRWDRRERVERHGFDRCKYGQGKGADPLHRAERDPDQPRRRRHDNAQ